MNLAGRPTLRAGLPDLSLHQLAAQVIRRKLAGTDTFLVYEWDDGTSGTKTVNSLNWDALRHFTANPTQSVETQWKTLCREQYGPAAPSAEKSLRLASAASDLIFGCLGIVPVDHAQQQLQQWLTDSAADKNLRSIASLLSPTEGVLREVRLEADTAAWLLRQSRSAAEMAWQENPTPHTGQLLAAVQRAEQAVSFCRAVTECFARTQLYAQDAAPLTRQAVEETMSKLPALAAEAAKLMEDSTLCNGLDPFIQSVKAALSASAQNAPIAKAILQAQNLAAGRRHEAATEKLLEILQSPDLAPHVNKHKLVFGTVASSLETLWSTPDNMISLRGGDGQWTLAKKAGQWCWSSTERFPCIYFDILVGPLERPADYVLSFDYFDEGDFKLWVHYDSHYPGGLAERQFHPADPVQLSNTKTWKHASRTLTQCRFGNGQNENADLRLLGGRGKIVCIRNLRLAVK
jgi:hypothetical protein